MAPPPSSRAGLVAGRALAPLTAAVSALRRSRMFHPVGSVYVAIAEAPRVSDEVQGQAPAPTDPEVRALAEEVRARLLGPVLVRFSGALWKKGSWPDVLGCALRFSAEPEAASPLPGDQDLLLASIRRPWTMIFSPFATNARDYFGNRYYGVSPFTVSPEGEGRDPLRIEWRLRARPGLMRSPTSSSLEALTAREQALRARVDAGDACFILGLDAYPGCLHLPRDHRFVPVVALRLLRPSSLDQEALRFEPFRHGRGIVPVGFVQEARRAAYAASQAARPGHAPGA